MDEAAKKTALRMIPYGMYVLTTKSQDGEDVGAATVNWLTQTSFSPPLVAVGIKADSGTHQHIKDTGVFAVNVIGSEQKDMAFTFFKPNQRDGNSIGGEEFEDSAETGSRCCCRHRRGGTAVSWARSQWETTGPLSQRSWTQASAARTTPS